MVFVAEHHWILLSPCMVKESCFLLVLASDIKGEARNSFKFRIPQDNLVDIKKKESCASA